MSYFFHPAAEAEYLDSVAFYESKQAGLGAAYLAEFENMMRRVCQGPLRYSIERKPDVRRIHMSRFPFRYCIVKKMVSFKFLLSRISAVDLITG